MKITRILALAVIAASAGVAPLNAQSLRDAGEPAEFPPASYKSTQYIDSKGCVFVRAGISGNVTWIPRVTRARKQVCGQQPSLQGVRRAAAAPQAVKAPQQITLQTQPVAAQAAPKPVAPRPVPNPLTRRSQTPVAAPRTTVPTRSVAQNSACGDGVSQAYRGHADSYAVRCGPQTQLHYSLGAGAGAANGNASGSAAVSGGTRIVPRHVATSRVNTQNLPVPKGYRKVWEDDRLNPHRGEQSVAGHAATQLVWTNTVPRRLIDRTSGRDVTPTQPIVSTRSVPGQATRRAIKPVAATQSQFVNVGTYADAGSAQQVAKKVRRMGMPVRIGKFTRSGQTLRMVLAGPFTSGATESLNALRRAGYSGAKLRK